MRTIYIDSDFKCHVNPGENLREVQAAAFNGMCDEFVEGYRFVPKGESWTREDGVVFNGELMSPIANFRELDAAQRENEQAALEHIGIVGISAPLEQSVEIREAINIVISGIDDTTAINIPVLFPQWSDQANLYAVGDRVQYKDRLFKCLQSHTSQTIWTPDVAVSLFVEISNPAKEWPVWIQPINAETAYALGAKVTHNGICYISKIHANVTVPGSDSRWWEAQV